MKPKTTFATAIAGTLLLSACAGDASGDASGASQDDSVITLSYAEVTPENGTFGSAAKALFEAVQEEYDGHLDIDYHFSGSLLSGDELLRGTRDGVVDFALTPTGYFPDELPIANWAQQFSNYTANGTLYHSFVTAAAQNELYQNEPIQSELDQYGLESIAVSSTPGYALMCIDPIESSEDAAGTQVRVPSPDHADESQALGMDPVTLSAQETYEGLQRGTIDCNLTTLTGGDNQGLYEQAKYVLPLEFSSTIIPLLANKDKMDSLPEDLQTIIRTTGRDAYIEAYMTGVVDEHAELLTEGSLGEDSDTNLSLPDELTSKLAEYQQSVSDEVVDTAPSDVSDPEIVYSDYRDRVDQWASTFSEATGIAPELPNDGAELRDNYVSFRNDIDPLRDYITQLLAADFGDPQ